MARWGTWAVVGFGGMQILHGAQILHGYDALGWAFA